MATSAKLTLVAAILGSSIVFVDSTVVNVALPPIQRDLGGGLAAQQWIVDAYLLTLGSLILVGGSLGDIFGEFKLFTIGVAAFGVTSVLCGAAPDSTTLIVFRGLQGVAGAMLTPASLAVITATFSGAERGAAIGTWTAWGGVGTVLGPLLGGWLIGIANWRIIFFLNVPLVVTTLAIAWRALPRAEPRAGSTRVDVVGAVLCVAGLGAIVFGFIEQPTHGWDATIAVCLAGGAAALAAFVVWEMHASHPMLELRLFTLRNFSVTNVETFAIYGGLSAWSFFLVVFLQQLGGYSPFGAGLALLPVTIVMFAFSRYVGRWSMQVGPRLFMSVGPVIAGLSVVALARLPVHLSYWADLLPPILGFSIGLALTVAPLTTTVLSDAGRGDAGIASAVNNAVARVAGLIAIAVIGLAASRGGRLSAGGFHAAMAITGALIVAGGVIGAVGIRNPAAAPEHV
ncbi:MAG TPA: DHA2 family efflux MFS transporter permease subunit [Gaiellaceae bacterium]|nr:DHA2 family efflux MFS transporter permease subunit [Gaiellaceae bacterium]